MPDHPRYPGYDTLAKRDTPSWNARTRAVVDKRLATPATPRFFTADEWATADALCHRILPGEIAPPLVALLDAKLLADEGDGTRDDAMPYQREAWRRALAALDGEASERFGRRFRALTAGEQDALLTAMQAGQVTGERWSGLDAKAFFERRVLVDVPPLFYSLPQGW